MDEHEDRITLLEEYKKRFFVDRDEGRKMREKGAAVEEAATLSIEATNGLIARCRELQAAKRDDSGDVPAEEEAEFDIRAIIDEALDVKKLARSLGVEFEERLSPNKIYDRLLTSFQDDPVFRSVGQILAEFTRAGYDVTRDQIRGSIKQGLSSRSVIRLSFSSSRRWVWYGLPEWVDRGGSHATVASSHLPQAAERLTAQTPMLSYG